MNTRPDLPIARKEVIARVLPFILFMAFIGGEELVRLMVSHGILTVSSTFTLYLYPIKTVSVLFTLLLFFKHYEEIRLHDLKNPTHTILAIVTGVIVFILWINMDWPWATLGTPSGYDPTQVPDRLTRSLLIISRIIGASIVVPIMEELFWRSFVARYLISPDILDIPIGRFTLTSFTIGSLLFGLEHSLVVAGIMAGIAYNFLLWRTKSILQCILAHGLTNLLLGLYVLLTRQWQFW
jgi:CAAX prenyl protease-like protein